MERHPLVLPFYQWPNGAKAELRVDPGQESSYLKVQIYVNPRPTSRKKTERRLRFSCATDRRAYVLSTGDFRVPHKWICRLRGMFLDMEVLSPDSILVPNLHKPIPGEKELFIDCCKFVPDSVWSSRYGLPEAVGGTFEGKWPGLEDFFPGLRVARIDKGWSAQWRAYRPQSAFQETREELVDEMLRRGKVLPESARGLYEVEHVRRGVFLHPSPDEIEMLRLIDEPLPFFLPPEEVWEWASSNGAKRAPPWP